MTSVDSARARVSAALGLERNIVAVSVAMFLLALGENLWKRFLPKYLEILGGWIGDRYGRRRALRLFVALAMIGYGLYWLAPSWPFVFAGLLFVMAWSSMASPPLFAVVGDALPRDRRALGFTVQSILKRVPIAVAPTLGGLVIAAYGVRDGVHLGLGVTVVLAAVALAALARIDIPVRADPVPTHILAVWRSLPPPLRWLLTSDIFIRTCEGLVDVFLVLYAINVIGVSAPAYGILVAVQMTAAIVSYLPVARFGDRFGRKPFVIATFAAFALFPVAVVLASDFPGLVVAFVVGGVREVGEPARKALIVDLVQPTMRARSVGLYYLVRSLAIAPAAFIGGLLWGVTPALPFWVAGAIGLVGVIVFTATVEERYAG